jgi:hypothetical protein
MHARFVKINNVNNIRVYSWLLIYTAPSDVASDMCLTLQVRHYGLQGHRYLGELYPFKVPQGISPNPGATK